MTLIDRLSKLGAPDREVDARIWCEVNGVVYLDHYPLMHETQVFYKEKGRRKEQVSGDDIPHAALYTTSVDAAIALAERVLPGWNGDLDIGKPIADSGKMGCRIWTPESKYHNYVGEGFNSATALLIAILRAKEASYGQ